jgi:hypothetical protein
MTLGESIHLFLSDKLMEQYVGINDPQIPLYTLESNQT